MRSRVIPFGVVLVVAIAAAAMWFARQRPAAVTDEQAAAEVEHEWLVQLYSQNPRIANDASRHLAELGPKAIPAIRESLEDPSADATRKKAAMKAAGLLGPPAAELIPAIAAYLPEPGLTAEAAVALSFLGRDAFGPLRDALDSNDPAVRREALRSLGKLRERAPLESRVVVPLLIQGTADDDASVRAVAATYLGIIGEQQERAVPALLDALDDEEADVRTAAATALGSFPRAAPAVIPALRRAMGDSNAEVAREAGVSIVKLQGARPPK